MAKFQKSLWCSTTKAKKLDKWATTKRSCVAVEATEQWGWQFEAGDGKCSAKVPTETAGIAESEIVTAAQTATDSGSQNEAVDATTDVQIEAGRGFWFEWLH